MRRFNGTFGGDAAVLYRVHRRYKVVGEGERTHTKCVCRGDETAPFEIEPNEFSFSFGRKELQTARVTFLSTEHRDFAVQEALCVHPAFSATCDRKTN